MDVLAAHPELAPNLLQLLSNALSDSQSRVLVLEQRLAAAQVVPQAGIHQGVQTERYPVNRTQISRNTQFIDLAVSPPELRHADALQIAEIECRVLEASRSEVARLQNENADLTNLLACKSSTLTDTEAQLDEARGQYERERVLGCELRTSLEERYIAIRLQETALDERRRIYEEAEEKLTQEKTGMEERRITMLTRETALEKKQRAYDISREDLTNQKEVADPKATQALEKRSLAVQTRERQLEDRRPVDDAAEDQLIRQAKAFEMKEAEHERALLAASQRYDAVVAESNAMTKGHRAKDAELQSKIRDLERTMEARQCELMSLHKKLQTASDAARTAATERQTLFKETLGASNRKIAAKQAEVDTLTRESTARIQDLEDELQKMTQHLSAATEAGKQLSLKFSHELATARRLNFEQEMAIQRERSHAANLDEKLVVTLAAATQASEAHAEELKRRTANETRLTDVRTRTLRNDYHVRPPVAAPSRPRPTAGTKDIEHPRTNVAHHPAPSCSSTETYRQIMTQPNSDSTDDEVEVIAEVRRTTSRLAPRSEGFLATGPQLRTLQANLASHAARRTVTHNCKRACQASQWDKPSLRQVPGVVQTSAAACQERELYLKHMKIFAAPSTRPSLKTLAPIASVNHTEEDFLEHGLKTDRRAVYFPHRTICTTIRDLLGLEFDLFVNFGLHVYYVGVYAMICMRQVHPPGSAVPDDLSPAAMREAAGLEDDFALPMDIPLATECGAPSRGL
ncbi:hypothetical protein FB451DRAFT_1366095 [Mycena latifolia]|nr:hypothetical protein FB451DRAFT_1366095 [Mycena latifolia]